MKKTTLAILGAALVALVLSSLLATTSEAVPSLWPRRGELCWLDDEGNTVRAFTARMGGNHYLLHGSVIGGANPPPYDVQPFSGNIELLGGQAIGQVTTAQINDVGEPDEAVESFTGIVWFDLSTLDGTAEGISTRCDREPTPNMDCETENHGPVVLVSIACP